MNKTSQCESNLISPKALAALTGLPLASVRSKKNLEKLGIAEFAIDVNSSLKYFKKHETVSQLLKIGVIREA
jgi:hypothetical protein